MEKPRARRGGWSRLLVKLVFIVVVMGLFLFLLHMNGIIDLYDILEFFQGLMAEFL